jgi:hypothetical protein
MNNQIEAMKQALEWIDAQPEPRMIRAGVICDALRQSIEQAEKHSGKCGCGANLYIDENGTPCSKAAKPEQENMCVDCGKPTMHMGNKCYGCCQTAQPELEPVAAIYISISGEREFDDWKCDLPIGMNELFTAPPRKEWVELNLDDIPDVFVGDISFCQGAKWAQAKLKEKNGE